MMTVMSSPKRATEGHQATNNIENQFLHMKTMHLHIKIQYTTRHRYFINNDIISSKNTEIKL